MAVPQRPVGPAPAPRWCEVRRRTRWLRNRGAGEGLPAARPAPAKTAQTIMTRV